MQFRAGVTADQVRSTVAAANAQDLGQIPHIGVHVLQLPKGASEIAFQRAFAQHPQVAFAELDMLVRGAAAPNDPGYAYSADRSGDTPVLWPYGRRRWQELLRTPDLADYEVRRAAERTAA